MGPIEMSGPHRWNTTTIVAGMSVILLILTVMNLGLFFKLWAMEDVAHRMYLSTKHRLRERTEASMQTLDTMLAKMFHYGLAGAAIDGYSPTGTPWFKSWVWKHFGFYEVEGKKDQDKSHTVCNLASEYGPRQGPGFRSPEDAQLLKTVLQDSINLLEQLRSSLLVLQQNFALANRTAAPQ